MEDTTVTAPVPMSRVQLALRVSDVDAAARFYAAAFDTPVAKRRPGYANFEITDPPLKLVLIEAASGAGGLDHLGVEVDSPDTVDTVGTRLAEAGLLDREESGVGCCYAVQDKVWAHDPDGAPWEWYVVTGDHDAMSPGTSEPGDTATQTACCGASGCGC